MRTCQFWRRRVLGRIAIVFVFTLTWMLPFNCSARELSKNYHILHIIPKSMLVAPCHWSLTQQPALSCQCIHLCTLTWMAWVERCILDYTSVRGRISMKGCRLVTAATWTEQYWMCFTGEKMVISSWRSQFIAKPVLPLDNWECVVVDSYISIWNWMDITLQIRD